MLSVISSTSDAYFNFHAVFFHCSYTSELPGNFCAHPVQRSNKPVAHCNIAQLQFIQVSGSCNNSLWIPWNNFFILIKMLKAVLDVANIFFHFRFLFIDGYFVPKLFIFCADQEEKNNCLFNSVPFGDNAQSLEYFYWLDVWQLSDHTSS